MHFANNFPVLGKTLIASSMRKTNAMTSSCLKDRISGLFFLTPTTPEEICNILHKTCKNSFGPDKISTKLHKDIGPPICVHVSILVSYVVNISISQGTVPDTMKIAKVIPVFKAKDHSALSNYMYRPISLLPCVSKTVEHVPHKRLYSFLSAKRGTLPKPIRFPSKPMYY